MKDDIDEFNLDASIGAIDEIQRRFKEEKGYSEMICNCGHTGKQHDSHSYVTHHVYCYKCNCKAFTFTK